MVINHEGHDERDRSGEELRGLVQVVLEGDQHRGQEDRRRDGNPRDIDPAHEAHGVEEYSFLVGSRSIDQFHNTLSQSAEQIQGGESGILQHYIGMDDSKGLGLHGR